MKNQIYLVVSYLTVILAFVPLVIILLKKFWQVSPFNYFAVYWAINGVVNSMLLIKGLNKAFTEVMIVVYNALDIPMMVFIIYLAASSDKLKRLIRIGITLFLVFEIACLIQGGFKYEALKYSMALGLVFMMTIIIWQISLFMQQMEHATREKALLLIHGALLFQYGTYIVVYVFDYYVTDIADNVDKFLIYYISTIISIAVGSSGLFFNGLKRIPSANAIKRSFWAETQDLG